MKRKEKFSSPRRYLTFFVLGLLLEVVRLVAFHFFLKEWNPLLANVVSVPIETIVAFLLYARFIWPGRPGSFGKKLVRFSVNKGITMLLKLGLFPLWLMNFPCPLLGLRESLVDVFAAVPFAPLLLQRMSCELLSVATMDLVIALTITFTLHDAISFAKEGVIDLSDRRGEMRRILVSFGTVGLIFGGFVVLSFHSGLEGLVIGVIFGYLIGVLFGALYIAIARTGLYG